MSSSTMSKRTMAIGLIAAFAMAVVISMTMTSPAMAAQKKPYKGYQDQDTITIYDAQGNKTGEDVYVATRDAGSIKMLNVGDTRKMKPGFDSFVVWSGEYYKDYLNNWTDNDADKYTIVDNVSQFKKLKGMSYNAKKNTLTLNKVKAPQYLLRITGMGSGFKIVLKGKNQLAGIQIAATETCALVQKQGYEKPTRTETGYYTSCVKIDGKGSLAINKKKYLPNNDRAYQASPIYINGGGMFVQYNPAIGKNEGKSAYTKSKFSVTKNPKVQIYAYGGNNLVTAVNSAAKKPVSIAGLKKGALDGISTKVTAKNTYEEDEVYYTRADGKSYWGTFMKLNDGSFYGQADTEGAWYFDTKDRKTYYSTWNIYQTTKPATTYIDEWGDEVETYAEAVFVGQVGNDKNHPKGYTPILESTTKAHYSYVAKNSKLVAGK